MRGVALGSSLLSLVLGGCLEEPKYACSDNSVCVINNVMGVCDVATSTCLYPGPECESDLRDGHGNCVDPIGMASTSEATMASVSASDPTATSAETDPTEPSTSDEDPSTETSVASDTTTTGAADCDGTGTDITEIGVVGASSVFVGYPPINSTDGDFTTSWFSTGPEGAPTVYSWTLSNERCIDQITLTGNGMHSNPAYRTDFGFGAVTVKVFDQASELVFTQMRPLGGTPDPEVELSTGGVIGTRLVLEFTGHESPDCGGFSELQVLGE